MDDPSDLILAPTCTLRDCLESFEATGQRIVLVVDDGRLVGTVADGDVRRALLTGAALDGVLEPHMQRDFVSVSAGTSVADILDLMRARVIDQIPEVEADGRLVALHTLRELLGASDRPNSAVIMAGGEGRRLRPLTQHLPKPMLRVGGRPILERIVHHLVSFGIRDIFLSVNYLGEMIESHFRDGSEYGCQITYLWEKEPLGTAGPLASLPHPLEDPLLVINGDILTTLDIAAFLRHHEATEAAATIAVRTHSHAVPFGVLDVVDGRIRGMREKPVFSWPTNAGIYALSPQVASRVPEGEYVTMPELLQECLNQGELVAAYSIEGEWADVGEPDSLEAAHVAVENT